MITIEQLLESVDLDFEPRFVTKDRDGEIRIWNSEPVKDCIWHIQRNAPREFYGLFITDKIKISEFADKPWQECIYEVPRKTTGKIEKIHIPDMDEVAESAMYSKELAKRLNQVIDAVNKHADIIQQIGDWGTRKGECLWCETLTKFEPNELKGAK